MYYMKPAKNKIFLKARESSSIASVIPIRAKWTPGYLNTRVPLPALMQIIFGAAMTKVEKVFFITHDSFHPLDTMRDGRKIIIKQRDTATCILPHTHTNK